MTSKRLLLLVPVLVAGLALAGCDRQMIGDINADPGRYNDKEVSVAGRVTSVSFGALGMGVYQIDDGTGKLFVYAEKNGAPREGATVAVKGRVMPTFTFLGKNYATVLREAGRKGV